ncbi:MAG: ABC transporter permease [Rhizobiales bacterium]|nr:ABC transporter permease [Hyphomicrobiales bacterium]
MTDQAASMAAQGDKPKRKPWPSEFNALLGLVIIAALFEALAWMIHGKSFLLNVRRLEIMILQVSVIGIVAVGVSQVIISGGIDLSGGSIIGATAMIAMSFGQSSIYPRALFIEQGWVDLPVIIPIIVGLTVGFIGGLINGLLIAYTKIPPFIATLGMMVTARGVAKWYTKGQPISFPTESYAAIGTGMMPVVIFLVIATLFYLILKYTLYGKRTYAIGSNAEAARMSGINVERHLVLVYTIAGLLAGLAGLVLSSRGLTAQAGMGVMYELDAIAMAVIGGVSLSGGRGSIVGTAIGMVIFGIIISGFIFLRLDAYYQEMVKGVIIVAAVVSDVYRQKRRELGA